VRLRWFDERGAFLFGRGARGHGPGEYEFLDWMTRLPGDSMLVFDAQHGRMTVYDSAGALVRTMSSAGEVYALTPIARFADGMLLARAGVRPPGPPVLGHVRHTSAWIRTTPVLGIVDTIVIRPGGEGYTVACGELVAGRPTGICNYAPFFARVEARAVSSDRLFLGDGDRYEIDVFTTDGRFVRSIRRMQQPRTVTPGDLARQREEVLTRYAKSPRRAVAERILAEIPVHETMPAFSSFRGDAVGNLWVEEYRVTANDPPRWTVFDSTGRMLGALEVPRSLRILEIGANELLGIFRDSLDVEQVRAYRIRKP
jgi:hypothetical protein